MDWNAILDEIEAWIDDIVFNDDETEFEIIENGNSIEVYITKED